MSSVPPGYPPPDQSGAGWPGPGSGPGSPSPYSGDGSYYAPDAGYAGYPAAPGYPAYLPPPSPYGYPSYPHRAAPMESTAGLRRAAITLFWLVAAAAGLLVIAVFARKGSWDDFVKNPTLEGVSKIDDADNFVAGAVLVQLLFMLTSTILVCLWAQRVCSNARVRGLLTVRPGLAAGGWFIPIGWYWVGFNEVRKAANGLGRAPGALLGWQIAFAATGVCDFVQRLGFDNVDTGNVHTDEVSDALSVQGVFVTLALIGFVTATVYAMSAMRRIETVVNQAQ